MNEGLGHTALNERVEGGAATTGAASLAVTARRRFRTMTVVAIGFFRASVTYGRRSACGIVFAIRAGHPDAGAEVGVPHRFDAVELSEMRRRGRSALVQPTSLC